MEFQDEDVGPVGSDGIAILSCSGRKKFALRRATLLGLNLVSFALMILTLSGAVLHRDRELAWAKTAVENRLQADWRARKLLAQDRLRILAARARTALGEADEEHRPTIARNLDTFAAPEKAVLADLQVPKIDGDVQVLTTWTSPVTGKSFPLNATKDGALNPKAVEAFLHDDPGLSTLMGMANRLALVRAEARPEEINARNVARIHREVEEERRSRQ